MTSGRVEMGFIWIWEGVMCGLVRFGYAGVRRSVGMRVTRDARSEGRTYGISAVRGRCARPGMPDGPLKTAVGFGRGILPEHQPSLKLSGNFI